MLKDGFSTVAKTFAHIAKQKLMSRKKTRKMEVIDICCSNCKSETLESVSMQKASDSSYIEVTFHCYDCGANTAVTYLPTQSEIG